MTTVEDFSVSIDVDMIADLNDRLAKTRWPDQLPGTTWELGTDSTFLKELCDHWATDFDWGAFEARCNRYPQVKMVVDGTTIHAITAKSAASDATPLLLLHGWPGSVAEYFDVIEPLLEHHDVIVPSLPGYGFSGPTTQFGIDAQKIGDLMVEFMHRLGYERFFVAGGDWGAMIGPWMGGYHPDSVMGLHIALVPGGPPVGVDDPMSQITEDEMALFAKAMATMHNGSGYQAIQSTKPQSLAYGLTDSPAGLAGWIIEKFHMWSDCNGDLLSVYTMDRLLENVSIYWLTGTINSSTRLYYETMSDGSFVFADRYVGVPTGQPIYPGEIFHAPRAWAESNFNIVYWEPMPRGGHFAAMEVPEIYAADVAAFTAQVLAS
jgi:pimeloyl-ACP methyl ester carboxylesterase